MNRRRQKLLQKVAISPGGCPQSPFGASKRNAWPWLSWLGSSPLERNPVYFSALSVLSAFHFLFPSFSALIFGPHTTKELVD